MLINSNRKIPFGLFTLVFVGLALAMVLADYIFPVSPCSELETQLKQGYFMQWLGDALLVVTADKEQFHIAAATKEEACSAYLRSLHGETLNGN